MAFRKKMKLSPFIVTHTKQSGDSTTEIMKRGSTVSSGEVMQENTIVERGYDSDSDMMEPDDEYAADGEKISVRDLAPIPANIPWEELPTINTIKQQANVQAWQNVRTKLLNAVVESNVMPHNQVCSLCDSKSAKYRCNRCGPCVYYCETCLYTFHNKNFIFHVPEEWKDGLFLPIEFNTKIDPRSNHVCSSKKDISLCILDDDGVEHKVLFVYCECEPLVVTMTRAQLWPSSPTKPNVAFAFQLLDWFEALLLECQTALKDLCSAIYFKCPHLHFKKKDIYSCLIDAFEEYRYMKQELRTLSFYCKDLDSGNICPACPKVKGHKIISMDAVFGLPRRKKAGISYRDSLHGHLFFADQIQVDHFVNDSYTSLKNTQVENCSDFKAGTALRSATRFHALDETAVFGCACRHEFPIFFLNLKHGEKYSYAIWMIEHLLKSNSSEIQIHLMYDIACNVKRYLENTGRQDILQKITSFSVPSFHAYGHSAQCQVDFSPLRTAGIGLSDGEVMERLWAYLRRFGRMTKEMRPSHRTDVLTHALLYYSSQKTKKLTKLLAIKWSRTQIIYETAVENYQKFTSEENVTEPEIMQWIIDEKKILKQTVKLDDVKNTLKVSVVRRMFLIQLKSKHAEGQKISKRLSGQISKETRKIQKIFQKINESENTSVQLNDVMDLNSNFWSVALCCQHRQKVIYNYLLMLRSQEELKHLEQDMLNTLDYFYNKKSIITSKILEIEDTCTTTFTEGIYCLLKRLQLEVNLLLFTSIVTFKKFINIPPYLPQLEHDADTDDKSSDNESDSDCETEDEVDLL